MAMKNGGSQQNAKRQRSATFTVRSYLGQHPNMGDHAARQSRQ